MSFLLPVMLPGHQEDPEIILLSVHYFASRMNLKAEKKQSPKPITAYVSILM